MTISKKIENIIDDFPLFSSCCFFIYVIIFIFLIISIFEFHLKNQPGWASSLENLDAKMPQPVSEHALNTWFDQIDMHWGGRLKAIGSATFARNNTIFPPVAPSTDLLLYPTQ